MRIRLCRPLSLSSLFSFSYFLIYINPMLLSFYKVSKFCSIFSKMVSDSCVIFLIDYFTTSSQNYKSIIIIKKPSLKTELNQKKKKNTYSETNAWQEYHQACTQQPATSHLHHSSTQSNWLAFDASTSLLPMPPPTTPTNQKNHKKIKFLDKPNFPYYLKLSKTNEQMKKKQAFYSKLFWVRPSQFGELFHSDPSPIVEATFVDQIGSFLTTLRDYEV